MTLERSQAFYREYLSKVRGGACACAPDVVQDGVVEEDGVLGHDCHVGAQGRLGNLAYVLPINLDHPRGGVVESEQQPQRAGFSAACAPNQAMHDLVIDRNGPDMNVCMQIAKYL